MKEKIEDRMKNLKNEFVEGQQKLMELEAQTRTLREALLRISGAIQVLEEEMRAEEENSTERPATLESVGTAAEQE